MRKYVEEYREKMIVLYEMIENEEINLINEKDGQEAEIIEHSNGLYSLDGDIIADYEIREEDVIFINADMNDYTLKMIRGDNG